jgi:hypothetical protein
MSLTTSGTTRGISPPTQATQSVRQPHDVSLPDWVLSHEETQALHAAGYGTGPDLIYARGVPDSPSPDPTSFSKKLCTLIIIEIGFCRDLGCEEKRETKINKYIPLVMELRKHWGTVEFVAFPIGHAGTTLKATLDHLTSLVYRPIFFIVQ